MMLELGRDDRSSEAWKRDLDHIEFMRVGRNGEFGAAEYLYVGARCVHPVVPATPLALPWPIGPDISLDEVLAKFADDLAAQPGDQ